MKMFSKIVMSFILEKKLFHIIIMVCKYIREIKKKKKNLSS